MSPYEQAMARVADLERQNADLRRQIKTEHAGVLAGIKLERDLFASRYDMKNKMCVALMQERANMVVEMRSLQDDKMLLDWFNENNHYIAVDFPPEAVHTVSQWAFYCPKDSGYKPVRERLKIAMRHSLGIDDSEELK
jgi:hypothetical protein